MPLPSSHAGRETKDTIRILVWTAPVHLLAMCAGGRQAGRQATQPGAAITASSAEITAVYAAITAPGVVITVIAHSGNYRPRTSLAQSGAVNVAADAVIIVTD